MLPFILLNLLYIGNLYSVSDDVDIWNIGVLIPSLLFLLNFIHGDLFPCVFDNFLLWAHTWCILLCGETRGHSWRLFHSENICMCFFQGPRVLPAWGSIISFWCPQDNFGLKFSFPKLYLFYISVFWLKEDIYRIKVSRKNEMGRVEQRPE